MTIAPIHSVGDVIRDASGRPRRAFGVVQDITQRKRTEEALSLFRSLIDRTNDAIEVIDPLTGRFLDVNQQACTAHGYTREEYLGLKVAEVNPWVAERRWQDIAEEAKRVGARVLESQHRRKDGSLFPVEINFTYIQLDRDYLLAVVRDITERKRAEEKLKQSESQLAEAQRLAHFGNWEWDLRSGAVTWSDELYRIFGVQPGEIDLAQEAMSLIHADDREMIVRAVKNSLHTAEPYDFYYRVLRPDGQQRIAYSRGYVVSDENAAPIKIFGTTQDVTESKQAEQALRESADRLQALSRRLLEVQEAERRRLARELHDEFGQILAAIALHLHAAKRLAGEAAWAGLDQCAALLRQAADQVRSLALELRPAMLDTLGLEATLRWLAEQHQQRTGAEVQIVGHLSGEPLSGELAIACFRVAQEALTNVMRHAAAQHVWIDLCQRESSLELAVRDDGLGFDVSAIQQQAAQRGHLGLLGMRERVQILGGSLDVASEPGAGTCIRASLPLGEAATQPAERAE